ncbi:alpha/beta hydrolase [Demequina sp.]|uniref:alpha/beta hydrolase n=1 Tax=Demequina sp. TaxID=2050685 RepID=UPI0025EC13CC|nr:alpha/beta hydrolase [Demequina sp.]
MITSDTEDVGLHAGGYDFTVRVYPAQRPDGTLLVWLHGGAFIFGDLEMTEADATARALAVRGTSVVSVDYTLASLDVLPVLPPPPPVDGMPSLEELHASLAAAGPRAPYPAASLQVVAAFDWAVEHAESLGADPARVSVGGASAGGNLAASAAVRLRDRGESIPATEVLIYPVLHAELPAADEELLERIADLHPALDFPPHITRALNANYLDGASPDDAYAFPGGHDPRGLPPTLIVTADKDRLRASGQVYAAELAGAGVDVELVKEPAALHGFLSAVDDPARHRTLARISRYLTEHAA